MGNHKLSALFLSLFCLWPFLSPVFAQNAFQLARFTLDEDLRSDVTLTGGVALPLGKTQSQILVDPASGESVPWGAKVGGVASLTYQWFAIPQLSFGFDFTGQWYGYEYQVLTVEDATRIRHSGWGVYSLSAVIGTRIELGVYGLYYTANVKVGYGLMQSPRVQAIYADPDRGDMVKTILSSSLSGNFYVSAGMGIQYRFRQRWIASLGLNYAYMPTTALGSNQLSDPDVTDIKKFNLSSFIIGAGISYAF